MGTAAALGRKLTATVIDRNSRVPFYLQVHDAVRLEIETGAIAPGEALPSVSTLVADLSVSKNTVRRALAKLATEGHITGDLNNGYKVPEAKTDAGVALLPRKNLETQPVVFNRISVLEDIDLSRLHVQGPPRPFRPALPDTREFPLEVWEGLRTRLLRERTSELLDFCGTFGYLPLRQAIAVRLRNARGLKCSAEQVIVCAGAQQALNLLINTLVSPGDAVGMEEPGFYGVKAAFLQAGAKIQPLLVDEEGLVVPDARRLNLPSVIYSTPPSQFPLGASLSLPRRLALLAFARRTSAWIIEDDSDGDFSYTGRPLPSLQGLDDQNRVIYLGTTGKTLFPSLEIGYVVVPLSLMESFSKTKEIMGGQPCVIDQATLARFVEEGHFDRHLHRMNLIYYQRLQALSESVDSELDGYIDLEPANAGLHAVGWLARGLEESVVANCAASAGIELPLLSNYGRTALVRPGVLFGFASYSEKKIKETIHKLGKALRSPPPYQTYQTLLPSAPNQSAPRKNGFLQRLFRGI
jgi:GntR family transcriptional regulator/MocR family aminotransferase